MPCYWNCWGADTLGTQWKTAMWLHVWHVRRQIRLESHRKDGEVMFAGTSVVRLRFKWLINVYSRPKPSPGTGTNPRLWILMAVWGGKKKVKELLRSPSPETSWPWWMLPLGKWLVSNVRLQPVFSRIKIDSIWTLFSRSNSPFNVPARKVQSSLIILTACQTLISSLFYSNYSVTLNVL